MNVEYKSVNNHLRPRLVDGDFPDSEVINCFLEDAENSVPIYLNYIERAENGEEILGAASNQVGVDFYTDKVAVEHLWSTDENGENLYVELPLSKAKDLLISLEKARKVQTFS